MVALTSHPRKDRALSRERALGRLIAARSAIHEGTVDARQKAARDLLRLYELLSVASESGSPIRNQVLLALSYDAPVLAAALPAHLPRLRKCMTTPHEELDLTPEDQVLLDGLAMAEEETADQRHSIDFAILHPQLKAAEFGHLQLGLLRRVSHNLPDDDELQTPPLAGGPQ